MKSPSINFRAWRGIAVGLLCAVAGILVAAFTRVWMWIWPFLGTVIIVATFFVGLSFANAGDGA